jgi:biopolymer transport protein TolQ
MEEKFFEVAHLADRGVLYLLVILSLVSLLIIVERYLTLTKAARRASDLNAGIQKVLASANLESYKSLLGVGGDLENRSVDLGIQAIRVSGARGLRESFDTLILLEKPKLERSLGFLATVGANAPYIGLFGTVLGIMKAFKDLGGASEGGQGAVMAGISGALIATAAGLMVAIPAVLAFNYFQKLVKQVVTTMEAIRELAVIVAERGS